jgi:hypothetical protein
MVVSTNDAEEQVFFRVKVFTLQELKNLPSHSEFPHRKSGQGMKLTTHLHLVQSPRTVELYLYFPIQFHSMVLNWLNTGKTLLFYKLHH